MKKRARACCGPIMYFIGVAHRLESPEEAEGSKWVGTVQHLSIPLYLKSPFHFFNQACDVVIFILGSVPQIVTAAIQACAPVSVY